MNMAILIGRLTKDPEVRYGQNNDPIAKFTLAVDRRGKDKEADFLPCVAFKKTAEFCEKYLNKGSKVAVKGSIKTGSYDNKEGKKVYTTDIIVDEIVFMESKNESQAQPTNEGFINIPDSVEAEGLPFK